jgi:23S rRNA pseudouridine1911/1915/1917 synthase
MGIASDELSRNPRVILVTRGDAGDRLDRVVRRHLADVKFATRTTIQRWIAAGGVTVNGRPASRAAARVAHADVISLSLPAAPSLAVMRPEPLPIDVLVEDAYLLAVNKPPGLVVHPTYRHPTGTLMNALLWHARAWPEPQRPSLVGRLDKGTSGIVLIAKTRRVHAMLQRAMATSSASKEYLALVYGHVRRKQGIIDLPLARDAADRRRVTASRALGSPAVTRYERLTQTAAPRAGLALLRCRLLSGRMHQIRVHLAASGWPIVGDPVYGEDRWQGVVNSALAAALRAFPRQALHAWRLSFPHPLTGSPVRIEAPPPPDLSALLQISLPPLTSEPVQ